MPLAKNKLFVHLILPLLYIFCIFAQQPAPAQDFSIEHILSAPYLTNLVAAPDSDRIAWVENIEGQRNIWMAAAPNFEAIKLTNYSKDDGMPISQLAFSYDSAFLIYVHGGSANRGGEHPNPTSAPSGADQGIWAVRTQSGSLPWRLAHGSHPVLSPTSNELLFTDRGQIFLVPITLPGTANRYNSNPRQFINARGSNGYPQWSPEGNSVAFVSSRGDHSFIGVCDYESRQITWMAPSVDRDQIPCWSPDGKRLAFIRMPGAKKDELHNITDGTPFALHVADVSTGTSLEIWQSPANDGGFAQSYPRSPLRWTRQNQLLFYSEHENWLQIYSIQPDGKSVRCLTPAGSEVEVSSVSASGEHLYFSSNAGDSGRRHLWRVALPDGTPEQLTSGRGIETDPVALASGNFIAYRLSGATLPSAINIVPVSNGRTKRIFPIELPKSLPQQELVVPQQVTFQAADGLNIHGQLFAPKNASDNHDHPAVIFMHGGPIRQMLLGWHYRSYYAKTYAMNQFLANQGYLVLSVNYRSGIGYGRAFRQAVNQGPRGASEYQDILAAANFLRSRPEVDPARIGLWGGSYGGYLTALGLARNSDIFAAGVDLHGVHDWAFRATDFSQGGGWGLQGEALLESAFRSSPVAALDTWHSPILLVHGDDDRNVLFQQTTDLVQRLRERNVPVELLIFPDEVHGFLRHESWLRTFRAADDFFERTLKKKKHQR